MAEKSRHLRRLEDIIGDAEARRVADCEMRRYLEERCHEFCHELDQTSSILRAKVEELAAKDAYVSHLEMSVAAAKRESRSWHQRFTELMVNFEMLQRENVVLTYEKDVLKDDLEGLNVFIGRWQKIFTSFLDREPATRFGFEIHVQNQMRASESYE